ncbi:histidine kinase-, DNA gyrase B-, and HSP90-like ATPase family protein [Tanacetum coccineum]
MEEKETTILPTVQDKWVSLHESFGHIYWCDDEQLKKEFMDLSNVHFLCLGELTNEEKQMIQDEVSVLFRRLGIPCLSEVVTRKVIHYGPTDSSYMISLVRWALPYAQRYIYRMHPNEYSQLKLSGFKKVNSLKIVVANKLCQKYVIKSFGIESKESECCCLLQDNILYATRKCDSHSLFMELSHLLLVGLPLANFLDLITTKAQSGFKEEDMELFVTNNQKLQNLPCEELEWSLASTSSPEGESTTINKKLGKNSSWPPVHWKTTPGVDKTNMDAAEGLFESNGDWIIDENPSSSMPLVILEDDEALNDQSSVINKGKNKVSVPPQNVITGREGERAAFKYFSSTLSDKKVKWVNKVKESGLPYDILVEGKDKSQEYIEVKSTSVAKKDWFNISMNEWKFAIEKGESFIIARVVLSDGKLPKITTYKNPAKLLQSRHLQLAFHPKYDPIISVTKRKSAWDDNSISGGDSCSQYRIRWKQEGVMDESKWWMTVAAHWILSRRNEYGLDPRWSVQYFSSTLSEKKVKWVNKVKESGLPYDILVEGKDKSQEYIEVKSTSVAKKDWFNISMNEWKFAIEKGESFIIARVVLSDGKLPKITTYRNPAKLLQSRHLQLAFHPSKK